MTAIGNHYRGDTFERTFTLGNSWVSTMFSELWFTLRTSRPESSVVDDTDAIDQATVTGGEITFSDTTHGTVVIPSARTQSWPARILEWDLQGKALNGDVYTIDSGQMKVLKDVTRSTT